MSNDNFGNEFALINSAKTSNFISSPGVYEVEVKEVAKSEDKKDYKKTPFFEFTCMVIQTGKTAKITLYRATNQDTDDARNTKLKKLKELFESLGVDLNQKDGGKILTDCIGKKVKALFKQVEKIKYNKDANLMPYIDTNIEYSFCKPINEELIGTRKYLVQELNQRDKARFDDELKKWEEQNPSGQTNNTNTASNEEKFNASLQKLGEKETPKVETPAVITAPQNAGTGLGAAFGK